MQETAGHRQEKNLRRRISYVEIVRAVKQASRRKKNKP
jgi:hypothetical protein